MEKVGHKFLPYNIKTIFQAWEMRSRLLACFLQNNEEELEDMLFTSATSA